MRHRLTLVVVGTTLLATAGCSGSPSGPPEGAPEIADSYRAAIDQLLAGDELSDLARDALEDYWVTDEEYAQAREPIPDCLAERGFDAFLTPNGGVDLGADTSFWNGRDLSDPEVSDAADAAMNECQADTMWIESYYWDMRKNPQNWDYWEALQQCAERLQIPEGMGMSTEELKVASLESEDFLAECKQDPWSLAQGREPEGGYEDEG